MKINRRKFIRYLSALGSTLFLPGSFFSGETKAAVLPPLKYKPEPDKWRNDTVTLCWVGHSTVLINFYGKWILTDPVLSRKIGVRLLGSVFGPTRQTPPALSIDEIPKPDLILLSHAHMDHMDYPTLEAFTEKYPGEIDVVTAYLTADVIDDLNWKSVTVLDWNEKTSSGGIEIRALEVKHFG